MDLEMVGRMKGNGLGDDTWKSTHSYKSPNTPATKIFV